MGQGRPKNMFLMLLLIIFKGIYFVFRFSYLPRILPRVDSACVLTWLRVTHLNARKKV